MGTEISCQDEEYKDILRDFYAGLAMMALIPMIDSAEGGQRMPSAAFDIATKMIVERSKQ
jgi:hypothetical protein